MSSWIAPFWEYWVPGAVANLAFEKAGGALKCIYKHIHYKMIYSSTLMCQGFKVIDKTIEMCWEMWYGTTIPIWEGSTILTSAVTS